MAIALNLMGPQNHMFKKTPVIKFCHPNLALTYNSTHSTQSQRQKKTVTTKAAKHKKQKTEQKNHKVKHETPNKSAL